MEAFESTDFSLNAPPEETILLEQKQPKHKKNCQSQSFNQCSSLSQLVSPTVALIFALYPLTSTQ